MQIYKYIDIDIDIYSSRLKDLQKMTFFIIKKKNPTMRLYFQYSKRKHVKTELLPPFTPCLYFVMQTSWKK